MKDWKTSTLGELTSFMGRGKSPVYADENDGDTMPVLNQACVQDGKLDLGRLKFITRRFWDSLPDERRLQRGDVLINSTGTGTLGRLGFWKGELEAAFDGHVTVLRFPEEHCSLFFYYLLSTESCRSIIEGECTSGSTNQVELLREQLRRVVLKHPLHKDTQSTIAELLSLVDRAIEQTEALLAKQQRIKTGLIHDLLTRGLDAQGRLRDPSTHKFKNTVLGSVPVEWDETNIGALAALVTSGPRGWARYYSNAGAKFIRIGNLTREHVNFRLQDMQFVSPPDGAEGNRTQLMPGDVLFSITADLGVVGLVPPELGPAYINQHIALIRPKTGDVVSGWLANFLASHRVQKWISNINESGAKAGLNLPTIKGIPVTAPKPPEQQMIADILALCDRQIAEIRARILKLRRQKAGLMHDLLTGRVPVTLLLANPKAGISS